MIYLVDSLVGSCYDRLPCVKHLHGPSLHRVELKLASFCGWLSDPEALLIRQKLSHELGQ